MSVPFAIAQIEYRLGEQHTLIYPDTAARTGIPKVHTTETDAYSLALKAALQLGRLDDISVLIYVTQSPTWLLGSHACRMQHDLRLNTNMLAFDIGQGCSGFVQALSLMARLLVAGQRGLIITADNYPGKDPDKGCQPIFSAGAAATLIDTRNPTHRIVAEEHYTDGAGADLLSQPVGGSLSMDGRAVYLFTRNVVGPMVKRAIAGRNVDVALLHQASKPVLDGLVRDLEDDEDSPLLIVPCELGNGNTVSSTIPILLADGQRSMLADDTVLMAGFGVGLSAATLVLEPV